MKNIISVFIACFFILSSYCQEKRPPIIDMHIHAHSIEEFKQRLPNISYSRTQAEFESQMMSELEKYNIVAYASGPHEVVRKWQNLNPKRIKPGILAFHPDQLNVDSLRAWHQEGSLDVIGEIAVQYMGLTPDDPRMEPIWKLAEELDIPLALHMGIGPPDAAYGPYPKFRARNGNPLLLEDILAQYPTVRVYVMHAGWPFLEEMIALLWFNTRVYVDVGFIDWGIPRDDFHFYLKRIVDAGFVDRIMFGTDQLVFPEKISSAIESIETAEYLTEKQKRDIFYNNAARFLKLSEEEIAEHHEN